MKPKSSFCGKIVFHDEGLGAPTSDMVRQRARELAAINGRRDFTATDWEQAKRELHGGHEELEVGEDAVGGVEGPLDGPVGTVGHRVPRVEPEDSESISEELIAEGMDEAIHERMLEATRLDDE